MPYLKSSYAIKRSIMRIIGLLFCLLTAQLASAQSDANRLSFGITISPDICYRALDASGEEITGDIVIQREGYEKSKVGITAGLSLLYRLNDSWSLESGIHYSDKGEQTERFSIFFVGDPNFSDVAFRYHYRYIDIPLKANYFVRQGNTRLFVSAGVIPSIFIDHTVTTFDYNGNDDPEKSTSSGQDLEPMLFSWTGGMGVHHRVSDALSIRAEVVHRRAINSMVDAPIKHFPISTGLQLGIFIQPGSDK